MVGHWSELRQVDLCWRLFGAFKERGRGEKHGTNASSSPVLCASKGRRRHMVPFKMTLFLLLFFFPMNCMKQRRFSQNASFHLNGNWRQNVSDSKSGLQFACLFILVIGFGFLQSSP
jgi:hypothetical protein